jgi:hypothetical protein
MRDNRLLESIGSESIEAGEDALDRVETRLETN